MPKKRQHTNRRSIRLGFAPLNDCAPIVMAQELGLFSKYGIDVTLSREVGWATIRDKIIYRELDAAHAPAPMAFAASLGLGSIKARCLTGLVLNLHGNAITLSERLWKVGVRDGHGLRKHIHERREQLTLGVVSQFSSHNFLLRKWLRQHAIDPERDVQIVVVPPPQMFTNLKAGHLDGYCVGEPWNSVAVMARAGWCPAISAEIAPRHPEKVLMVSREFDESSRSGHIALIAALREACEFCAAPQNRERIMETLAQPQYLDAPIASLRMSMAGSFHFGHGRIEKFGEFIIFSGGDANAPTSKKAAWVINSMLDGGSVPDRSLIPPGIAAQIFREDIHKQALQLQAAAK